jgi:predicted MPP superfamily phosphohydrolase
MPKLSRRNLFKSLLGAGGGAVLLGASGFVYGTRLETEWLEHEQVTIPIPDLPAGLEGFRIVLLSDFHLYPTTRLEFIEEAVASARALMPDLVVLTGDFVQKSADAIFDLAPVLARLEARHGVFCALGNHDHWKGPRIVRDGLESQGLPVLHNRGVLLSHEGAPLYLAGVDDCWSGRPDLKAAMSGHRGQVTTLLLSHEPDPVEEYSQDERVTLQLSGHSHGGQVRLPGLGSPFLPPFGRKYDMGLFLVRNTWLYTNRGIGVTAPIRLNCRPELTELTLIQSEASAVS